MGHSVKRVEKSAVGGLIAGNGIEVNAPALTPAKMKLIEAATDIRLNPDAVEAAFLARQLVLSTLPHSDPGDVPLWTRSSGSLKLVMARTALDETTGKPVGYPYGTLPRLLLLWINTEAVRTRNRRLELGHSLSDFMRELGLNPETGGGKRSDAKRLRDQITRLFATSISFQHTTESHDTRARMFVSEAEELWWNPKKPNQGALWGSWVLLGERFFEAIIASPVPLDMRALRALKRSPLALDLYAWATYRAFTASRKRTDQFTSWVELRKQLGAEYSNQKEFNRKARAALLKMIVYPALKLAISDAGITILPTSRPAIAPVDKTSFPR
jgi:hypothetical protein